MFGFPVADKATIAFKRNFLRSVIFQVQFPQNNNLIEAKELLVSSFSKILPRVNQLLEQEIEFSFQSNQTPILRPAAEKVNGLEFRSEDGQKHLLVTNSEVTYTISGSAYNTFEDTIVDLNLMVENLTRCDIATLSRIAIRKINIIEFQTKFENKDILPISVMSAVLNPGLLKNNNLYFPNQNCIQQDIHTINYIIQDYKMNLKYGLIVPEIGGDVGQIIVDIDLFRYTNASIDTLSGCLLAINNEIFNVFNWSLSDSARKILL